MPGPEFFQTGYGRRFYDVHVPALVSALERIAGSLEKIEPVTISGPGSEPLAPIPISDKEHEAIASAINLHMADKPHLLSRCHRWLDAAAALRERGKTP